MSKLLLEMIDAVANEKGMPKDMVRQAMEAAIAAWARREHKAADGLFEASIDSKTGEVTVVRRWTEVASEDDIEVPDAQRVAGDGVVFEETLPEPSWTRQGLQVVKQVLYQKIRLGLRHTIAETWSDRVGTIVRGVVKRVDTNRVIVDLGEPVEGVLTKRDLIPGENFRIGQRMSALVTRANDEGNGPVITLSRTADDFVRELVAQEVPEVEEGLITIKAVARDPGARAKVAIEADPSMRSSPQAACIGMRGSRVQAVSNEIHGERIDFVLYNEDPVQYILDALVPAEVRDMIVDEDEHRVLVGVDEDKLARAIGGKGQNVRLAARLTGWMMEIMSTEQLAVRRAQDDEAVRARLMTLLEVDQELADVLMGGGFHTVEDIFLATEEEMLEIEEFDEDLVAELKSRADAAVTLENLAAEAAQADPLALIHLEGVGETDIKRLNEQGVHNLQDLADQAVDDLEWPPREKKRLSQWIMDARQRTGMLDEPVPPASDAA